MVTNSITEKKKTAFSKIIALPSYQVAIKSTISDPKRCQNFITSITAAVTNNPTLAKCEPNTIITAALLGESLKLSPSPQLGQFYLVPLGNKAQFMIGYKGLIQLAIRSGQYKKLNVLPVKQGELIKYNPFDEEIEVSPIEDPDTRENVPTIGYYAMFEYINGFKKSLYWSREKMEAHAKKYSKAYSSFWGKDFDSMACKTMLRQLITKWGIISVDMQTAIENESEAQEEAHQEETDIFDIPAETQTAEPQETYADFEEIMGGNQ